MDEVDPCRCPLCGGANACGVESTRPCWCAGECFPAGLLARVPAQARNRACICKACVEAYQAAQNEPLSTAE